ncbi:MAG: copper resistance protein B [Cellvibrionales bacterium]|nr:copper resistance protein B [Cellvibrionales bacterium]
MRIKNVMVMLLLLVVATAQAHERDAIFHALRLELDAGESRNNESVSSWDLDGWIGGDTHKLWLKSEGEVSDHETESSEAWALYSYNADTFWDVQAGVRYDNRPASVAYFVAGVRGMLPFFIDTEAHAFVSDEGDVSARLHLECDWLLTQKLIAQPYFEMNVFAQEVKELEIGSGLSDTKLGLQLRYEITRKFTPYIAVEYERLYGDTADYANRRGEDSSDSTIKAGVRLLF